MAVRPIAQLGNPVLRETCTQVKAPFDDSIRELVGDLRDTVRHSRETTGYGRGIAAPQIERTERVVFIEIPGYREFVMINPEVTWRSEETFVVWDACLSFLFLFMKVERHREVKVRFQDLSGEWHELHAGPDHDLSELVQHEVDHLDGILAFDRTADMKSFCSREEFELRYKDESPYSAS